jgi:hypothetical protein
VITSVMHLRAYAFVLNVLVRTYALKKRRTKTGDGSEPRGFSAATPRGVPTRVSKPYGLTPGDLRDRQRGQPPET